MLRIDDLKLQLDQAYIHRSAMILLSKSAQIRVDKANAEVSKLDAKVAKINAILKKEILKNKLEQ